MPALMTHHLFGEESMERLPEGVVSSDEERAAFLMANQGPDPFFFRVRSLAGGDCHKLGQVMHRSRMSRQFEALRDGVTHLQRHDANLGRAFVLGLLSHYVLDRNAHPFVYSQQWGIQAQDPDLEDAGSQVHAVIESDLDVLMVQAKRDGATVAEYPPAGELVTTGRIDRVAGALISFCALSVYGLEIGSDEYGGAVSDMQLAYRLIEPVGSARSDAIGRVERLFNGWSLLTSLAHRVTTEPPSDAGNLAHREWKDPFTGEASHESFPEVFERALADYGACARRFVAGEAVEAITGHVNYSGRHLSADEEFDREE